MSVDGNESLINEKILEELVELHKAATSAVQGYQSNGRSLIEQIPLLFLARATHATGAMLTLYQAGYHQDAGSILRTICELYIEMRYVSLDRTHAERFVGFSPITSVKQANNYVRIYPEKSKEDFWRQLFESERDMIGQHHSSWEEFQAAQEQQAADARETHQFGRTWAAEWNEETERFSNISTEEKAKRVDAARSGELVDRDAQISYETIFRLGSQSVHASLSSLFWLVEPTDKTVATISVEPTPNIQNPLLTSFCTMFLMKIFDSANDSLSLNCEAPLRRIDEFLKSLSP